MTLRSHTLAGRRAAARTMVDTVRVLRPVALGSLNLTTLAHSHGSQIVYSGPGRVRALGSVGSSDVQFGEEPVAVRGYLATLPWDCGDIRAQDRLEVVSSLDPQFAGRSFRVASVEVRSAQVFRRLSLEDDDA